MRQSGWRLISRAQTSFCWLPPDRGSWSAPWARRGARRTLPCAAAPDQGLQCLDPLAVVGDFDLVMGDAGFRLEPLGAGVSRLVEGFVELGTLRIDNPRRGVVHSHRRDDKRQQECEKKKRPHLPSRRETTAKTLVLAAAAVVYGSVSYCNLVQIRANSLGWRRGNQIRRTGSRIGRTGKHQGTATSGPAAPLSMASSSTIGTSDDERTQRRAEKGRRQPDHDVDITEKD